MTKIHVVENDHDPRQNLLLAALPDLEYERLIPNLEFEELQLGKVVYEPGKALIDAHFPISSVVSLLDGLESGRSAEIAVVGNEGIVGIALFMGGESMPNRAVVQSGGFAYRLGDAALKLEFSRSGTFQHLLMRYTLSLLSQIAQTAVCARHHSMDQQLCRWLLLIHDRLSGNVLTTTPALLADIMGVRPEGAGEAVEKLREAGLIGYDDSRITILDRPGLEARSCECYEVIRKESARLLSDVVAK